MGVGVSPTVSYLDVKSGPALLHSAGRAYSLHCGGGCVFFDWAPISGKYPTDGASSNEGYATNDG
jgi:hypothetical protein